MSQFKLSNKLWWLWCNGSTTHCECVRLSSNLNSHPKTERIAMFNTIKEAWNEVGGLSKPSKMPSYGYSLSAFKCKVGSKLRNIANSTCSDCYALKGRYVFLNVQEALDRRMDKLLNNPKWVDAMVFLLLHYCTKSKVFRWHDSGDIQSIDHLQKIVAIAERTPNITALATNKRGRYC